MAFWINEFWPFRSLGLGSFSSFPTQVQNKTDMVRERSVVSLLKAPSSIGIMFLKCHRLRRLLFRPQPPPPVGFLNTLDWDPGGCLFSQPCKFPSLDFRACVRVWNPGPSKYTFYHWATPPSLGLTLIPCFQQLQICQMPWVGNQLYICYRFPSP